MSTTWAVIGVTKADSGYYVIGKDIAVLADNNLMHGDRQGCFSKGDLVFFTPINVDALKAGDVMLYATDKGVCAKRISYIRVEDKKVNMYASTDQEHHLDMSVVDRDSILGVYKSSSTVLGDLASFSTRFSGVLVLYILPSIALVAYAIVVVFIIRKNTI